MKHCALFSGWEVRTRLAAACIWLVGLLFLQELYSPWLLTLILFLLMQFDTGISVKKVGHQLLHVLPFLVLMGVTLSISEGLPPTAGALKFAGLLCSRVVTAVLVVLALVGGKSAEDFIRSLAILPIPPTYLSLLFLTNRYVNLLSREFKQQSLALRSRMFTPKANPTVLKNIGYVVGGMFVRGYDRSEQVYAAMRARCYTGVVPYEEAQRPAAPDLIRLALSAAIFAGVVWLERVI